MKDSKSVKAWFAAKDYKESTKAVYLRYMATFCGLLNKTADQLASVSSEEALGIQVQLAKALKEELYLKDHSIIMRITALHSFWRANDVKLTNGIMRYEGAPSLQRAKRVKTPYPS